MHLRHDGELDRTHSYRRVVGAGVNQAATSVSQCGIDGNTVTK